jgi:hypothetical protein
VTLHPVPEIGHRRLRQIPVFLYFSTDTCALHVYVRVRTDDFPVIGSVDRMAYCSASHVVRGWCALQPPVHRVWRALRRGAYRGSDTKHPKRHIAMPHLDTSTTP